MSQFNRVYVHVANGFRKIGLFMFIAVGFLAILFSRSGEHMTTTANGGDLGFDGPDFVYADAPPPPAGSAGDSAGSAGSGDSSCG